MVAAWHGADETLEVLINAGADLTILDKDRDGIVYGAAHGGHVSTLKTLRIHGVPVLGQWSANNRRSRRPPRALVHARVRVRTRSTHHYPTRCGTHPTTSHPPPSRHRAGLADRQGKSPMHVALEAGHLNAAQYIKSWVKDDQRQADRQAEEDAKRRAEEEEAAAAAEAHRTRFSGGTAAFKRSWTAGSSTRPSTTASHKENSNQRPGQELYRAASAALALKNFRHDSAAAWTRRYGEHMAREHEKELKRKAEEERKAKGY